MISVFLNRQGDVLFTHSDVVLQQGDAVRFNGKIYLVVRKIFHVEIKGYEYILYESAED